MTSSEDHSITDDVGSRGAAIVSDVLEAALDDWVMAVGVLSAVSSHMPDATPQEVRQVALSVIDLLLSRGWMLAGEIGDQFVPWDLTPQHSFARIAISWPPDLDIGLGDVCWLKITEKGAARVMTGPTQAVEA